MSDKGFAPIAMAEDYWANSPLSVARYYGGIRFNGCDYKIVNKRGITIFELSDPDSKHYVGDGNTKAIEPGEPADLVREDFIPYYKKLGRDRFLEVLKEHQQASDVELKRIYKELTKKKKLGQFRELTQYLPDSVELGLAHGDEYFPANCFVARAGNTLVLSQGGYDKMTDASNMFAALAKLEYKERWTQQYLNTPK